MPPTSRGLLLRCTSSRPPPLRLRILYRRHAYSRQPNKISADLRSSAKLPTPQVNAQTPTLSPKGSHWTRALLVRLRGNTSSKPILRFLLWLPILAVIYHHFPLAWWPIEGPSMQPTFNPNHTSEAGTLNSKTSVLVLKQQFTQTHLSQTFRALFSSSRAKHTDTTPQRGQIVVYRTPHDPERIGVKRVVGIAGDRVTPLPGYPGGETPLIIPYNHLWLEGDVGDRARSVDSNYFGPISANLVLGRVLVTLPSFAPWFRGQQWQDADYPAKSRVEEQVVQQLHPDEELASRAFRDGQIQDALATVKAYPLDRKLTPLERQRWDDLLRVAGKEKEKADLETYELASELEAELKRKLFVRAETRTLKNVEMSREELAAFQRDGVVPESVLLRSNLEGSSST